MVIPYCSFQLQLNNALVLPPDHRLWEGKHCGFSYPSVAQTLVVSVEWQLAKCRNYLEDVPLGTLWVRSFTTGIDVERCLLMVDSTISQAGILTFVTGEREMNRNLLLPDVGFNVANFLRLLLLCLLYPDRLEPGTVSPHSVAAVTVFYSSSRKRQTSSE